MKDKSSSFKNAQTAIEYLLLMAIVAIIVFGAFRNLLPKIGQSASGYFNQVANGVMGDPPPCYQLATDTSITQSNAFRYLSLRSMSSSGGNHHCYDNCHSCWCGNDPGDHWPQNLIGCYEIADDSGNQDCDYPGAYIIYAWNSNRIPYTRDQIREIVIQVDTNDDSACKNAPGYENDDGWDMGFQFPILTAPNWSSEFCHTGGGGGKLRVEASFDANGLLDAITVRARDHNEQGYFQIVDMQIRVVPACP